MNIFDVILNDHQNIKIHLAHVQEAMSDADECEKAFKQLKHAVTSHARAEEQTLYDRLKQEAELNVKMIASEKEHRMVDQLFLELSLPLIGDATWAAKFQVLKENLEHHLSEEENEVLPKARKILSKEEAERLGEQITSF